MNFDDIDVNKITSILKTGSLACLDENHQEYYSLMELVRGLKAKMVHNNRVITKAGIIKLLKTEYNLSDYQARLVYADSLNFFYAQEHVKPEAFAAMYADRLEKWADAAALKGKEESAKKCLELAGKYRQIGAQKLEIPEEILNQKRVVIYTSTAEDLGVGSVDKKELEEFIDSIPEIPTIVRENAKMDAGIRPFDLLKRMAYDIKELSDEEDS